MKKSILVAIAAIVLTMTSGSALAGGKKDGASCHVHKSCKSGLCARLHPLDKFGVCCSPQDCAAQSLQCGDATNQCGTPINCGSCDPGNVCESNHCVPTSTSTTTTTTLPQQGPCDINTPCNFQITCGDGSCNSYVNGSGNGCECVGPSSNCDAHDDCGVNDSCPTGFACITSCCDTKKCWEICTATTTTTTTTLPGGNCDIGQACNDPIFCNGSCQSWVNATSTGCVCAGADVFCNTVSACDVNDGCPSGFTCVNNCCGKVCWPDCAPPPSTSTTSSTSTTTPTPPSTVP